MAETTEAQTRLELYSDTMIRISNWLKEENAVIYREDSAMSPIKLKVDFVVVSPVPFAVEVLLPQDLPQNLMEKAKQLLAKRLALAERFGPYMPLLIVVPETAPLISCTDVPFVDGVFQVDQLPHVASLPETVQLDLTTQTILKDGDPGEITMMNDKQFERLWSRSLTFQDMSDSSGFPDDTVAERIRRFLQDQSQRSSAPLETVFKALIERDLGGQFIDWSVPYGRSESPDLELSVWQAPNRRYFVLVTLRVDPLRFDRSPEQASTRDRKDDSREGVDQDTSYIQVAEKVYQDRLAQEPYYGLLADAWIIRAKSLLPISELVVLLGATEAQQIKTLLGTQRKRPIRRELVNALESAGWTVFPWDFAEPEPAFIAYLRDKGNIRDD